MRWMEVDDIFLLTTRQAKLIKSERRIKVQLVVLQSLKRKTKTEDEGKVIN